MSTRSTSVSRSPFLGWRLLLAALLLGSSAGCVPELMKAMGGGPRNFTKFYEVYASKEHRFQILNNYRLVSAGDGDAIWVPWPKGGTLRLELIGSSSGFRGVHNLHVAQTEAPVDAAAVGELTTAILDQREAATRKQLAQKDNRFVVETTRVTREAKPYAIQGLPGAQMHRLTFFHTVDEGKVGKEREEVGGIVDILIGVRDKRVFFFDTLLSGEDLPGYKLTREDAREMGYDYEIEKRDYRLASLKVLD